MARPREFDPDDVLKTAVDVFWEKGYHNGSVDEVVKRSGVAKYGIYGTFGTKRELFLKVLAQFAAERHQDIQRPIRKPDASLPEILAFFMQAPKQMTPENGVHGCLITNTGIELGLKDPEIRDRSPGNTKRPARARRSAASCGPHSPWCRARRPRPGCLRAADRP